MNSGNGMVAGNPLNEKSGNVPRTRSKFPLSYNFFNTCRFGEISPFFWQEGVNGDENNKLLSGQKVDSYTLKAPLMQDIKLKKDLFLVPRQAILPLNWDKFYTNPAIGDDVPDDCGSTVPSFWKNIGDIFDGQRTLISTELAKTTPDTEALFTMLFKHLVFGEMFYSAGSLIASLGIHGNAHIYFRNTSGEVVSFDTYFDTLVGMLFGGSYYFNVRVDNSYYVVCSSVVGYVDSNLPAITLREFLELIRDTPDFECFDTDQSSSYNSVWPALTLVSSVWSAYTPSITKSGDPVDIARPASYQLVCHHYYSNDHVDYVYSAELYRQYMQQLIYNFYSPWPTVYFTVNGIKCFYDALSAKAVNQVFGSLLYSSNQFGVVETAYLYGLFSYRHSLRFIDYFVGARTRPLAMGDTDVDVNSGSPDYVSVIDVTRNIQKQRFLNAVNRVGRKISDYVKMLSGTNMAPDFHNPLYLGHTSDVIFGDRSEYTGNVSGSDQNNITSVLKSTGSRYQFIWNCDRECIIIGVQYFDISRVYTETTERQVFHKNRFDMFNPFMQFIGDQAVYESELGDGSMTYNFGYQTRHSEYKQRYNQAAGGFVEALPSWIFKAEQGIRKFQNRQSPSFIRSLNSEFDRFYVSLTGFSLGHYFHFIVESINQVDSSRPMAALPDILQ